MSDKDLRTRTMEAGIVPKEAVSQMEQWQTMPEGSADQVGEADLQKVNRLRADLELQRLPTLRETVLDVEKIVREGRPVDLKHGDLSMNGAHAGVDRLGRYVFEIPQVEGSYNLLSVLLRPMTVLTDNELPVPRNKRSITTVSVLYRTVEQGNKQRVSVPTHWFCETEAKGEDTIVRGR